MDVKTALFQKLDQIAKGQQMLYNAIKNLEAKMQTAPENGDDFFSQEINMVNFENPSPIRQAPVNARPLRVPTGDGSNVATFVEPDM